MAVVPSFYTDQTIVPLSLTRMQLSWQFQAQTLEIVNDDLDNNLFWSYNSSGTSGDLKPHEHMSVLNNSINTIFVWSSSNSGTNYRIFATPN